MFARAGDVVLIAQSVDPGFNRHAVHRGMTLVTTFTHRSHSVARLLNLTIRLIAGCCDSLNPFDLIDTKVAWHEKADGTAMNQWEGLAIHFPDYQAVVKAFGYGHRSLHSDGARVDTGWKGFPAGRRQKACIRRDSAKLVEHIGHADTCPQSTARGADPPR